MKFINSFLILIVLLSCNQPREKQNETSSDDLQESQEIPNGEYADALEEEVEEQEETTIYPSSEDENFKYLVSGYFNMHLDTLTEQLSSKEVMRLFKPHEEEESDEGNQKETIEEKVLPNGNTLVTLTRNNLMDDSMKAEQYLMELEKVDGKWTVVYVKTNWKCRTGRGHTDWGIELCL